VARQRRRDEKRRRSGSRQAHGCRLSLCRGPERSRRRRIF
jgi:hypothetical protein